MGGQWGWFDFLAIRNNECFHEYSCTNLCALLFYIPTYGEDSKFPTSSSIRLTVRLSYGIFLSGCEWVSHCGSHFPLPGDNDALHHFEHLVAIFTGETSVLIFWPLLKSGLLFKVPCSRCKLCYSRNFGVKLKFSGNKLSYPILFSSAGYQTPGSMPYCSAASWATFLVAVGSVLITLFSVFNTGNYVYF